MGLINQESKIKYLLVFNLFIVTCLSSYWLKSHLGIDFLNNYTLSNYFPFNYLVPNKVVCNSRPGIIIQDSFDSFSLFGNWNELWIREEGLVSKKYDQFGLDKSRCLLVTSKSDKSWSTSHKNYIQVEKGDTFTFKMSAQLLGDKLTAFAGVTSFDKSKNAINWNFISEQIEQADNWITIERSFIIPEGISYIMFKISGAGIGQYRFDDIYFIKNQPSDKNPTGKLSRD